MNPRVTNKLAAITERLETKNARRDELTKRLKDVTAEIPGVEESQRLVMIRLRSDTKPRAPIEAERDTLQNRLTGLKSEAELLEKDIAQIDADLEDLNFKQQRASTLVELAELYEQSKKERAEEQAALTRINAYLLRELPLFEEKQLQRESTRRRIRQALSSVVPDLTGTGIVPKHLRDVYDQRLEAGHAMAAELKEHGVGFDQEMIHCDEDRIDLQRIFPAYQKREPLFFASGIYRLLESFLNQYGDWKYRQDKAA